MMFSDLRDFIGYLEEEGELIRVKERLSACHEIPAAMKFIDQKWGSAAFFEEIQGYDIPVIGNLLGNRKRLEMALSAENDLTNHYLNRTNHPMKPVVLDNGPVKEVILGESFDILKSMPVLTHHEKDAGPYLTAAVTMAKDPDTRVRGMGIHRIQIKGPNRVGILLASPPLSHFFKRFEERGKPMEVAIAIGMDPITFFSSVIWAPKGVDKFDLAGGLKGEAIELVKCESVDLEVPARADFVLEGRILPHKREKEGPFGESTGVYLTYENPIAEIDIITHRKNPIYHALMPFTGEESVLMGVSWEAENLRAIQRKFPQVVKAHISPLDFGKIIVQIDKKSDEDPKQVIDYVLELNPQNKSAVIIDTDVDIYNPKEVAWALSNRFQPDRDVIIRRDLPGSVIDPSANERHYTSKIGFDATRPLGKKEKFEKVRIPENVWSRVRKILEGYAP
jgi:2,5-furandicarboxylate decarboxylase 1